MANYISIIQDGDQYKIGHSVKPDQRLKEFQTGNPRPLEIVFEYETAWAPKLEEYLQAHFKTKRTRGEWYALTNEDLSTINDVIDDIRKARSEEEAKETRHFVISQFEKKRKQFMNDIVQTVLRHSGIVLDRPLDEYSLDELIEAVSSS